MNRNKNWRIILSSTPLFFVFGLLVSMGVSCVQIETVQEPPRVLNFSPREGGIGSQVTITGSGFSENIKDNVLLMGGLELQISAASTNTLIANIVPGSVTSKFEIRVNNSRSFSQGIYSVFYYPIIDTFKPSIAAIGQQVAIIGANYSIDSARISVFVGGIKAQIVEASYGKLVVIVPENAVPDYITVRKADGSSYISRNKLGIIKPPVITSFTPTTVRAGSLVTLTGLRFDSFANNLKVQIGDYVGVIQSVNKAGTEISFYAPAFAVSDKIVLTRSDVSTSSTGVLNVESFLPQILNMSAYHGHYGDTITVDGIFSENPVNNIVSVNGINFEVISSTASQMKVRVPTNKAVSTGSFRLLLGSQYTSADAPFKYDTVWVVSNYIGKPGVAGDLDGTDTSARLNSPTSMNIHASGVNYIYLSDQGNHRIKKIILGANTNTGGVGTVSTIAGKGVADHVNISNLPEAGFNYPMGLGNLKNQPGVLLLADQFNHAIKKVDIPGNRVSTFSGQPLFVGSNDNAPLTSRFNHPMGVIEIGDPAGSPADYYFVVSDSGNHTLRKIPGTAPSSGVVTTFVGSAGSATYSDASVVSGVLSDSKLNSPAGMYYEASSQWILLAERGNNVIRKIDIANARTETYAGQYLSLGFLNGDRISNATFRSPIDIAKSSVDGCYYVCDYGNNAIRKIDPATDMVTTLAGGGSAANTIGTGLAGFKNGLAENALFDGPSGIFIDPDGSIYISDKNNHCIRKIHLQ